MSTETLHVQEQQPVVAATAKPSNSIKPLLEMVGIIIFFSWLGVLIAILSSYR